VHVAEGILPAEWAVAWAVPAAGAVAIGLDRLKKRTADDPSFKSLVALMGAAVFAISLMPIPVPVAGSVSHPAGTPLAAIVVGPWASVVLAGLALLVQALFFAHGGLTTLGANILSEGMVGSFVGFGCFWLARRRGASLFRAGFLAGVFGDVAVYLATATELGLGLFPWNGSLRGAGALFLAFLPTQLPLAILEGVFTGGVLRSLAQLRPDIARGLRLGPADAVSATPRGGRIHHHWKRGSRGVRVAIVVLAVLVAVVLLGGLLWAIAATTGSWVGIDAGIMERVAEERGRAARTPFINTDVGDLLLFVFFGGAVVAGAAAGWIVQGMRRARSTTSRVPLLGSHAVGGAAGGPGGAAAGAVGGPKGAAAGAVGGATGDAAGGSLRGRTIGARRWVWGLVVAVLLALFLWGWLAPGLALGPLEGAHLRTVARVMADPSGQQVLSARGGDAVLFAFTIAGLLLGTTAGWSASRRFGGSRPRLRLPHLHGSHDIRGSDRHAWRTTVLSAVDARVKLAVGAVLLGVNLVAGRGFSLLLLAACLVALLAVVRIHWIALSLRMLPALVVGAMLVLLQGLTTPGRALISIALPRLAPVTVSGEGLLAGSDLAAVVLAGVSLLLLLGLSTPLPALLGALRWYRVPGLLIDLGMLMYRYLFLFVEEAQRMRQAQRLRGPDVPWRRAMGGFNSLGANLLIRSYDRSQRVYDAQRLRGGERRQ